MTKINFLKIALFIGDVVIAYAALFLSLLVRNKGLLLQFTGFLYHIIALYAVWIIVIFILHLYDLHFLKKPIDLFFNLVIFSIVAFLSGVVYFYFLPLPGITPKILLLLNIIVFDTLFLFWRYLFNFFLSTDSVKEKLVIVGFHERLEEILPQVKRIYEVAGIFLPPSYAGDYKKYAAGFPATNTIFAVAELKHIVTEKKVTSIVFALDFYSNKDLVKEIFYALPLTLNYMGIDDLYESTVRKVSLEHLNEIWFLEKVSKSEDMFASTVKRFFDIVFSIIGSLFFLIFLPFIALAIALDSPGHVFYSQKRPGKNGNVFTLYKFRTMKQFPGDSEAVWREKDKSSITNVGRFLRRTHLDELPQSWSILKGELSFVGPRPEPMKLAKMFEAEIPFYRQRYLVKPGIIGWAQINFPASQSMEEAKEKFQYDLYYIKNRSLLLDLEIILKAIKLFFW